MGNEEVTVGELRLGDTSGFTLIIQSVFEVKLVIKSKTSFTIINLLRSSFLRFVVAKSNKSL